jgi:hypothetical protein
MPGSLLNTAEGGTNTTPVTTGNSGGASGDPWTSITGSPTFTTVTPLDGLVSYLFSATATQFLDWDDPSAANNADCAGYFYLNYPSVPSGGSHMLLAMRSLSGALGNITLTAAGELTANSGTGANSTTANSAVLTPGTRYLGEWRTTGWGTAASTIELQIYTVSGSTKTLISSLGPTSGTTPLGMARVRYGRPNGTTTLASGLILDTIRIVFGSATPVSPISPVVTGDVTGSTSSTGTTSGAVVAAGAVTGSTSSTGTVAGSVTVSGTVSGSTASGGTVAGSVTKAGQVTGSTSSTGSVAGTDRQQAAATGSTSSIGTVTAAVVLAGQVTGSTSSTGTVTGTATSGPTGQVNGSTSSTGTVSATVTVLGQVAGSTSSQRHRGWLGSRSGAHRPSGRLHQLGRHGRGYGHRRRQRHWLDSRRWHRHWNGDPPGPGGGRYGLRRLGGGGGAPAGRGHRLH